MKPIDIMIVGAEKAGTSSLQKYLAQHPKIASHTRREMTYFVSDEEYALGYETVAARYFESSDAPVILAKSVGVMYLPAVLQRLHGHNPAVRVVVCLRNPVTRAYSSYWFSRRMGWEDLPTFEEALRADPARFHGDPVREHACAYLERSTYVTHIQNIYALFPREQVHIFLTDDLKSDVKGVCNSIFQAAGLEPFTVNAEREHNVAAQPKSVGLARWLSSTSPLKRALRKLVGSRARDRLKSRLREMNEELFTPPPIAEATRQRLNAHFKPYNDQLSGLIGRDLSAWDR